MHKVKTDDEKNVCVNIHARIEKIAPFPAIKEQLSTFVFAVYLKVYTTPISKTIQPFCELSLKE